MSFLDFGSVLGSFSVGCGSVLSLSFLFRLKKLKRPPFFDSVGFSSAITSSVFAAVTG